MCLLKFRTWSQIWRVAAALYWSTPLTLLETRASVLLESKLAAFWVMTVQIPQELKKHWSFCYRICSRLSWATYLRGHNVNLRITSHKYEVHAVDCEQKWICVRTDSEKYRTCWLANIVPPESDLKKISSWMRVFGPWPFCWEHDHVCYKAYINNAKTFHWKNTKGEKNYFMYYSIKFKLSSVNLWWRSKV